MELMINIFLLVGSLALFLFGMKTMSEGLKVTTCSSLPSRLTSSFAPLPSPSMERKTAGSATTTSTCCQMNPPSALYAHR